MQQLDDGQNFRVRSVCEHMSMHISCHNSQASRRKNGWTNGAWWPADSVGGWSAAVVTEESTGHAWQRNWPLATRGRPRQRQQWMQRTYHPFATSAWRESRPESSSGQAYSLLSKGSSTSVLQTSSPSPGQTRGVTLARREIVTPTTGHAEYGLSGSCLQRRACLCSQEARPRRSATTTLWPTESPGGLRENVCHSGRKVCG